MELTTFLIYCVIAWALFLLIRKYLETFELNDLERKAIFITGCDSGFGFGLAVKCLNRGMPVFAGCLTEKGIDRLKDEASSTTGKLYAFTLDVGSDESVEKARILIEKEATQYGGLFGIVNNAGIVGKSFYDDFLTMDDYRETLEVNLFGVIRVAKALGYQLRETRGRILNMASACARIGLPGIGPYTVSKHGVSAYSDVIRQELRLWGISVHVLEPGFFRTPLIAADAMDRQLNKVWSECPERTKETYGKEFYEKGSQKVFKLLGLVSSPNYQWVVDTYFHALTARFPRKRYQIGWDHILGFLPLSMLPAGISDNLFIISEFLLGAPKPMALQK